MNNDIKAVIFDFDDTLVDTEGFFVEHLTKTVQRIDNLDYNVDSLLDDIERTWQKNLGFEDIFKDIFKDNWELVLEKYREDALNTEYKPKLGMHEYVDALKEQGIQLYILSNRTRMLDLRLEQAGFNPEDFQAYAAVERKPSQLAYSEVIKDIQDNNIEIDEVLIFGNHPDDYNGLPDEWKSRFIALPNNEKNHKVFLELDCEITEPPLSIETNKIR